MSVRRSVGRWLPLLLFGLILTPLPVGAVAIPADKLPPARVVQETRAELTQQGCIEQPLGTDDTVVDVPAGKPYRVAARDRAENTLHFCSIESALALTVVSGEAAGVIDVATVAALWQTGGFGAVAGNFFSGGSAATVVGDATFWGLQAGTVGIANMVTEVGMWMFGMALQLVIFALTPSTFITNPMVTIAWPLVQGIANVGFLIALLFIAFTTTLNLDIGGGVKKLLPRLFIAALLINFSLVFAGIILDLTKVLMALMINLMAGTSIAGLQGLIYENSALFEIMANVKKITIPSQNDMVVAIVRMILTWTLALSMLALGIGLLVRYIMLIVLLIISPLAYLAFAFPAADSLGKRWWSEFFKYAFYGPVALFFLALATRIADLGLKVTGGQDGVAQALNAFVMAGILVAAAIYAKQAGGTFSVATINFMQGQAKRVGRTGLGVATYIPRKAAKTVSKAAGDQIQGATKGLTNYGLARLGFDPNAKKTVAQKFVERRLPALTTAQRTAATNAKRDVGAAVTLGAAHGPANVRTPSLAPAQLQQKHVVQDMTEQEVRFLVESNHTTFAQKENLLSNPEAIKKFQKTPQGNALIQNISVADTESDRPTNLNTNPTLVGATAALANQSSNEANARLNATAKGNQALLSAMLKGFDKLENPPA